MENESSEAIVFEDSSKTLSSSSPTHEVLCVTVY